MHFHLKYLFASLAILVLAAGRIQAQPDPSLKATYGSVELKAGFTPDPYTKDLKAGGQIKTNLGGVQAHVAKAPDLSLHYTKGQFPLTFTVKSDGDTTLLINLPDGTWIADDDGGDGLNPLIRIGTPQSGRYDIYVGTFQQGILVPATLHITERDAAQGQPDPGLKATYGTVELKAGFTPDPFTKNLVAGGQIKTNLGGVQAHVARAPDFSLHYTKGQFPLIFSAKSVGDTTLLINLPDGTWVANDDGGSGLNPLVRLGTPQSGRYDIYVGTYQSNLVSATLQISEIDVAKAPPLPPIIAGKLPDCYVLSAGVDNYRNANKLRGCLNDARNTSAAFKAQTGALFGKVEVQNLLDGSATRADILKGLQRFAQQGKAHDFMVLFLSGHGGRTNANKTWYFLPFDYHPKNFAGTALTDRQILDAGDVLVRQKKNFVVIVDACFSGQVYGTGQPYLNRYQNPNEGGMILMLSSAADQTSTAMGNYSAFAKAFTDAMSPLGDLNMDSKVTLGEIELYSSRRTAQLLAKARVANKQNTIVVWSPSVSKDTPFAYSGKLVARDDAKNPLPKEAPARWVGSETLADYGKLSFTLYSDGRAVMVDAKNTTDGIWQKQGNKMRLVFSNGSVVYTGTINGATLSGTATCPSARQEADQSWTWSVQLQTG